MAKGVLDKIRGKIHGREYVMTKHAEEEMDDDGLSIFDVESAILTGKIVGRQRDRSSGEVKYLVRGSSIDGEREVVAVVKMGPTAKLVILTVYAD